MRAEGGPKRHPTNESGGRDDETLLPVLALVALLVTVFTAAASAAPHCSPGQEPVFMFGFAHLKSLLGDKMGEPIECEHANPENGDTLQQTTTGLAFYRKSTNIPTFTNGWEHWGLTVEGLILWTGDAVDAPGYEPPSTPTPAASMTSTATPEPTPTPPPRADPTPAVKPKLTGIEVEVVFEGFEEPDQVTNAGDGSDRLFVVSRLGTIHVIDAGTSAEEPFLDISHLITAEQPEQGLLGLAFHPAYRENGRFFVNYTNRKGNTVIAEYGASLGDPNRAGEQAVRVVLAYEQPYGNHNGGMLVFGPDGYLYIGVGDGGSGGDPQGNGQSLSALLGKMLGIDVDTGDRYSIPADNPFVRIASARPEIWAYGLRNPWRYSFDRETGDLYIADVGQNRIEEVSFQPASSSGGENYGWNVTEGSSCFSPSTGCERSGLVLPFAEYDHRDGCSVTGGYVYRGKSEPALTGSYLFADFCSGRIWTSIRSEAGVWITTERLNTALSISSFGEDESGEIYFTEFAKGEIYRVRAITSE